MCSCALDAAADRDDALGLREIHGLLGFAERRLGLLANRDGVDGAATVRTGAARALLHRVGAKRADLERHEVRRRPLEHDVGVDLALEHRPHEREAAAAWPSTPMQSVTIARSSRAASLGA